MRRSDKRRARRVREHQQRQRRLLFESLESRRLLATIGNNLSVGAELRNYRIAIGATAEYTAYHGGETAALAAIESTIDSLNEIFEEEFAIHFDLVSGTNTIYTNPATDPYSSGNLGTMLGQNQSTLDSVIGSANYDVGHVFDAANIGGLAFLGVNGLTGFKGRGGSGSSTPAGNSWIGLVAHEVGHQFGAEHTFNANISNCGPARESGSAYEPASGTTIMSYAGICGSANLQSTEDHYFHAESFEQVETRILNVAVAAPNSTTSLSNVAPTVNGGANYTIPANTPFELTASGNDADGDTVTYTWEQLDLGPVQNLPLSGAVAGPLFRSFEGTPDPTRVFPRLDDLLNEVNTAAIGEVLPTVSRDLNFRVTARDGNGGINSDDVLLSAVNTGSAFEITVPASGNNWTGGASHTVTWNVAGTTANGIDTANVEIILSTDDGETFPFSLATTANDGSHTIIVPNIDTSTARLKVRGVGNVFFDVSQAFTITADAGAPGLTIVESSGDTRVHEGGAVDTYTVALNTAPAGVVDVELSLGDQAQVSVDGINFSGLQTVAFSSTTPQTIYVRSINDGVEEGAHQEFVTHSVVSSTSAAYPTTTLINNVNIGILDDELPTLVGIDFDSSGSTDIPQNWTRVSFLFNSASNLTREDGVVTTIDFNGQNLVGGSGSVTTTGFSNSTDLPVHAVDLSGIEGASRFTGSLRVEWSGLNPNAQYGYYLFGADVFSGDFIHNVFVGGANVFNQNLTHGEVMINAVSSLNNTDRLVDYEQVGTSNGSGELDITVNAGNANGVSLAAIAIREIPTTLPAVTVIQSGNTTIVDETGAQDTFSVMLHSEPASNVVVDVASTDTGEATVDTSSLTFTPANWNVPQVVTVTGVNDTLDDDDQTVGITLSINDASSDNQYDPLPDLTVDVVNIDDDVAGAAGFTVAQSGGSTEVTEGGSTDTFTVVLNAAPSSDVVFNVSSNDTGEATVSDSTLTFTTSNWSTPQTVTVQGVNDSIDDGDVNSTISVSVNDASSDDAYDPLPDQTFTVTTTDDDAAGFVITETGGSTTVTEAGGTDTFTVVLTSEPTSDVVLTVVSGDTGEATVSDATLTFTAANWSTAQTITVTGADDFVDDGNIASTITIAVDDANSDDTFDPLANQTVTVTTTDDDAAGFVITETGGSTTVTEAGATDTFTVVLTSEPTSDVVLTVVSGDTGEATVSDATLTFTAANWNTAQTITVTGVDDFVDDGNIASTITIAVDDSNSDDTFDPLADQTVTVTTTDDDAAGFVITETGGSTTVTEAGGTDTFTVVLTSEPTSDVVLTVVSGDTGEATVSDATLTFTSANWNTAQTITVTGVDDFVDDGNIASTITIAVDDSNSDDTFDPLANQTVAVTTTDDDAAGFVITETGGSTTVTEAGGTDTFTVVLTSEPASDVVLTLVSGDTGEATVSDATLTFTSANWNTAQTITVTGVDDSLDDGNIASTITIAVDDSNSDDTFDPLADQTVTVTTNDDDAAGFVITETGGSTTVTEAGGTDTFTVVLTVQPTSDVVLTVVSGDTGEATVGNATLTFTSANWNTAQTITVTGVDDSIDDGNIASTITIAVDDSNSDDTFDPLADQTVTVTTTDDDAAGFVITETGGSTTVTEAGGTDTFTVVLTSEPTSDVVLTIVSGDTGEATVSNATLTFTSANWNTAQTITVTGVDDSIDDGNIASTITIAVDDSNSDDTFDPLADQTVTVTTTDNDGAGFLIAETGGSTTVTEAGGTDTFTVVLTSQPTSDVVLTVVSGDTGEATVSDATLTFTSANWNTAQTITVTGVDDPIDDGNIASTITIAVDDSNSDDTFDPLADQTVTVTTTDDDAAGFVITETGGSTTVTEAGGTDTFTVVLTSEPTSDVVLTVVSGDTGEATVSDATLTFTSANWNTAQTITVTGVDDSLDDGNIASTITIAVDDSNSDDTFDPLADQTVTVTTTDDDAAGFVITETVGSTTVTEAGGTDTFTVVLTAQPTSDVVLSVVSGDTGEATVSDATLTFTSANWNTAQTITVTGVDDSIDDGNIASTITIAVDDSNSDDTFDPLADQTVTVTTTDDDAAGFVITESGGSTTVTEAGGTDTFTVVLTSEPTSDVVLTVVSGDTGEATVSDATLTFTSANWNTAQTITVTGVDDPIDDGNIASTITIAVDDSNSDDTFDPLADQTVTVTTTDDDAAGFVITETGGSTTVTEAGGTDTFTVVLTSEPTSDVVLTVVSGDTSEATIGDATLTFTSANWNTAQTITVTGIDDFVDDGNIASTITIAVDDSNSDDTFDPLANQTVTVTTTDDDAAGFVITETGGSTTVPEAGGTDTFTVVLTSEPTSDVVLTVVSGDTGEATVSDATLTFTSANWNTAQTITVTGVDDSIDDGNIASTITIAVDDSNSDDTFDPLANQTVTVTTTDDDAAGFVITESGGSTTVTEAGGTDTFTVVLTSEPTSDVVLTVVSGDTGEATVSDATLTFTSANWNTAQTITVTGFDDSLDDGNIASTITIAVDDSNSDDTFDPLADQTVTVTTTDDDAAGFVITETGGSTTVTEAGGTDTFTVVLTSEPTSDVVLTVVSGDTGEATIGDATLTFTSANWNTAQTITVTGIDDFVDDGNIASTITIAVDDSNSDDTFDPLANQTVTVTTTDDDAAGFVITETGGSTTVPEAGGTDTFTVVLTSEPTSDVVLTVVSGDTGEATVSDATLTFTSANWNTAQTITVTGVDDSIDDGNIASTITIAVDDSNSDDTFDPLGDQTVTVTTTDDDAAGFVITETGGSTTVTEAGGTDTFTVVLTSEPTSDVVLTVVSGDTGEATVGNATLTFTSANWNTAQTITVTGVDDSIDDGNIASTITIAVDDSNSDDTFDPLADQTVTVTTTDNDGAGFLIAETGGSTTVTEAGGTDTFTVVLTSQPTSDVVLTVVSGDTGEATVSDATLTFTSANWNTAQTITVTGVDDPIDDGNIASTITIAIDDSNSDDTFDPLADQTVTVTTIDNDGAGFLITESSGSTTVTEAGSTDTFTVVLTSQPTSDVVLTVVSGDTGEATVSDATLTFTSANWNTAQTITVTGVDDSIDDGNIASTITIAVDDSNSDDTFDPLADQTVTVTTTDDDAAGFVITESGGSTTVTEAGGTDTFTVVLTSEPTSDVVLTVVSGDTGEATVSDATLTFTSANWNTAQTITVTGVDDSIADGNIASTITIAVDDSNSDDTFDPLADQTVTVTTTDDDAAGFVITETGGSTTVTEAGGTDTFTVVLTSEPTSDVVLTVVSGDTGEATVSDATLTFTSANWNTAQTITVTGVDDSLDDGNIASTITIAVDDSNSDDTFDPLADQTVTVTTTDDDAAGFVITETGGSTTVTEAGGTDTFTVVLTSEPTSDVVLTLVSGDTGEATVSDATLTFTSANWNTAQTITVTGVDDSLDDGNIASTITIAVDDSNSDDTFDPLADQTVTVTTTDDDAAGFVITESGGSTTVTEAGGTDTFTVVLTSEPTSNVVLTVVSGDTGEATVSNATLTFTSANWNTAQTITVTGVDDSIDDGNIASTITIAVDDSNSDDTFDPLADQTVSVTTIDNDGAGFLITESSGSTTVTEAGSTDTFTVVLTAQPTSDVVLTVVSGDTGEATVSDATLTFTSANWNTAQTITVTGVDDSIDDGNIASTITVAVDDSNSDDTFDPLADQTVTVTTTDDDAAGFVITESGGSTTVTEAGGTDTFTVVLTSEPTSNVVLTVVSGDTGEATVSNATLTFTSANWNTAQTITVTGVDDSIDDGNITSTITIAVDDSNSDDTFDPLADQTVSVTTIDNDGAGFLITESSGSTTVTEAGSTDTFTVVLTAQPTSDVVLTVVSGDTGEATVSDATLTFTSANWNTAQTITVTGVDDSIDDGNIASTITIAVDDSNSDDTFDPLADQTVTVTTIDNDGAGFLITESSGSTTVTEAGGTDTFTVVLTAQPTSDVVLTVVSGDTGEATVSDATLTFTSANWNSAQTITVTGVDDSIDDGNIASTITVAVDDSNSDDTFDPLADQTVTVTTTDDDTAGFVITETGGSTTVTEAGGTDIFTVVLTSEPTSDVVLTVVSGDTGEATVSDATLTFTSANWNTAQTITVTGVDDFVDDGNIASTITIAVDDSNSDDTFDPLADQTVSVTTIDNDGAGFLITESSGSTTVTEAGSTDTFTVVLTAQPTSDVVLTVVSGDTGEATVSDATLTFTSANWNTAQTITVTGVDDSIDDGNIASTITIAVDDSNSDDTFDPLADQTVTVTTIDNDGAGFLITESSGSTTVTEAGGTDTFTVVLTAQPTSDVVLTVVSGDTGEATVSDATLTFTSANWNSAQTITVTGVDDSIDDGNIASTITVAVDDSNSDDTFDPLADQTVTVTTTDDDTAGFVITETGGSTTVTEAGGTDTFTVVLTSEPTSDVVLTVVSGDTGEATVSDATLTFTSANWNTAQTITVTGVDDFVDDGNIASTITIAVDDSNSDDTFDPLADQTVTVTTIDNDGAGFLITESSGSTTVTEAGSTDTFTVVLTSQPTSDVVLTVVSGDTGEATVSDATLTFTSANWNTAQTITVTGVNDSFDDGNIASTVTIAVDDANSDDTFDALADQTVTVTTTDDDAAGFVISESGGSTTVTEAGGTDTLTVVLTSEPTSDVVLTIVSGDTGEATISDATLTFTSTNWNTAQTITVTGVDDSIDDGNITSTITITVDDSNSDDTFDPFADQTVTVTTTDDDAAGFVITETGGSTTVTEAGSTDTFTVVLTSQPTSDVVLTVVSGDTGEATVSDATLTFTSANWNTAQTITVTGVDDSIDDGNFASTITIAVDDSNSDDTFDPLADQTVTVTTTDDDAAGFVISESGGSTTVTEAGGTDTFTVVLTAQPTSDVVLTLVSGDTGEATVSDATLTFTSANWNTAQTITVTGVDDSIDDGNIASTITIAVDDSNSDDTFDPLADQTVTVTTTDDDAAGFVITESGGSTTVTEAGGTDTFTVVLTAQPTSDVVLTLVSGDTGEATVSDATLTFTSANWNTAQTITVTGVDDSIDDGNIASTITIAVDDSNSDDTFDPLADQTVTVTTEDDDSAAGFTITESSGATIVSETGSTDTFTVVLTAQPTTNVTLNVASADTGEATASPAQLTFTPANWNTAQLVTVTGVDDTIADGNQTVDITISIAPSSDGAFTSLANQVVSVVNLDDDGNFACHADTFNVSGNDGHFGVDFSNVAATPLSPIGTSHWSFDFDHDSQITSPGHTSVTKSQLYSSGAGFGWQSGVGSFARSVTLGTDFELLHDGHFANGERTFTADVDNGWYAVTATMGDASHLRDQMQIVDADTMAQLGVVSTASGEFAQSTFFVQVSDGSLDLQFADLGGDRYWSLNGLSIQPAVIASTTSLNLVADGLSSDTYVGTSSANSLVTVSSTMGAVLTPDASAEYAGVQVLTDAQGNYSFALSRGTASGTRYVAVQGDEVSCQADILTPSDTWLLDLDASGSDTQADYVTVAADDIFAPNQVGVGWGSTQGSFERTTGPSDATQDGHFGDSPATLRAEVPAGDYVVSYTVGDGTNARDQMNVAINGASVAAGITTLANEFFQQAVTVTVGASEQLEFAIDDTAGDRYWVVNAIEVRPANTVVDIQFTPQAAAVEADGISIDTVLGTANVPDGTLLTIEASTGAVQTDVSPEYQGSQVVVNGGAFQFDYVRPFAPASVSFQGRAVDGSALGETSNVLNLIQSPITVFDFNRTASSDTHPGAIAITPADLYSNGSSGWLTSPAGYQRGTTGYSTTDVALNRDGAWGSQPRTFVIEVAPNSSHDITVFVGDRGYRRDNIEIRGEDGRFVMAPNTAANEFATATLANVTDNGDGRLEITIDDLGGDRYWIVNGLSIEPSSAASPLQQAQTETAWAPAPTIAAAAPFGPESKATAIATIATAETVSGVPAGIVNTDPRGPLASATAATAVTDEPDATDEVLRRPRLFRDRPEQHEPIQVDSIAADSDADDSTLLPPSESHEQERDQPRRRRWEQNVDAVFSLFYDFETE